MAAVQTDEHSIDIDLQLDTGSRKDGLRTIHRVPLNIRKGNENAYEPKILSIGPYHRRDPELQAMEVHKKIKELEKKARNCYSEIIDLGSEEEFVEMMLLDESFVVQFLMQRNQNEESKQKRKKAGDPIYAVSLDACRLS